ncbi:MAG TPA: hypothetical protein VJZ76_06770 [Thermoanaerobaculia bacterium]|nr:hypothetical protein [Thermoanaerobaculia bacterium]
MKRLFLALTLLTACTTADTTYKLSAEPTLGAVLPAASTQTSGFVVGGAEQTFPAYRVVFHDVEYVAGVDAMHRIRFIETTDAHFRTREGLRVGATLDDVLAAGGRPPVYEAGWGRWSLLQSGWCAFFAAPSASDPIGGPPQVLSYFRREGVRVDQSRIQRSTN